MSDESPMLVPDGSLALAALEELRVLVDGRPDRYQEFRELCGSGVLFSASEAPNARAIPGEFLMLMTPSPALEALIAKFRAEDEE